MKTFDVPGMSVAIVKDGKVVSTAPPLAPPPRPATPGMVPKPAAPAATAKPVTAGAPAPEPAAPAAEDSVEDSEEPPAEEDAA